MSNIDMANTGMTASVKVLDMAQDVFEDVASMLIDSLNSIITGLGQNIDIYA